MKKSFVFAAFLSLFVLATAAFAQKADLSGTWNLDIAKSELGPQAAMIKSQTLTITQKDGKMTVATKTERNAPPADAAGGGAGGGGGRPGGGGGMGGGGDQSYTLDGKEVSTTRDTPNGSMTMKIKAEQSGSKVVVTTVSSGPNGDTTSTTTYELGSDGKGLTVTRESPRGKSKSVYTKG